jgi:hypothetical protein
MISNRKARSIAVILALIKMIAISFYFGYINAIHEANPNLVTGGEGGGDFGCTDRVTPKADRIKERQLGNNNISQHTYTGKVFPDSINKFAAGMLSVSGKEFLHDPNYDFGVPFNKGAEHLDALILYNSAEAIPTSKKALHHNAIYGQHGNIAKASVSNALENCDAMNVVFLSIGPNSRPPINDCYAIIGDFESYHINRWFRMPDFETTNKKERELKHSHPLRHFGRITLPKGISEFDVPDLWKSRRTGEEGFILQHFDSLRSFLENFDTVEKELQALITKRRAVRNNTVVVMTVNIGQSELLANFVCAARSRGLDVSNVVVFPTDIDSKELAEGLGLTTYFDEKNFGALPKGEARMYVSYTFASFFKNIMS